ncbi:Retrovirus-related Pol polyprotein from transposon TNT 1-94 [Dendrobium catenatum]|uniref:Retrovirus-related Pol polyprotein from transposon TNT 1-94 n=1 Tax=Dendrobium catenatum TaxID=906689 RepID=A0A2I0WYF2_9ASPA|nr:Retrovirus-related Pol polyprotein from transposon TNT 1-94 [Dendrobium catenatum]
MIQYLTDIKTIVDQIAAAGSTVDTEDVILDILNGLPNSYQSFKTSIRTMTTPLNLDQLYSLLISEEIHIAADANRNVTTADSHQALFVSRGRGRRSRGRSSQPISTNKEVSNKITITCQICLKRGHAAPDCWHRLNPQYLPKQTSNQNRALVAGQSPSYTDWFLDSGATSHMTNSLENLSIAAPYTGTDNITIGDGSSVSIENSGKGLLPTPSRKILLSQILHSPSLKYNLLSISQLTRDNNLAIIFDPNGFYFKDLQTHQILLRGPCTDGLYNIKTPSNNAPKVALHSEAGRTVPWHDRLGHPNRKILTRIASCNPALKIDCNFSSCSWCNNAKHHKLSFNKTDHRSIAPLDLIHTDVWGPAPTVSNSGYTYYVIFVDDHTRFTWLFPMRHKSEVVHIFTDFKTKVETLTSRKIKCLRTDGGGEYMNTSLASLLRTNGITHQSSCPHTPEQNGVAERKHRHIIETTRTILHKAAIPYTFWPDAAITSVYLINRLPSANNANKSPFELFHSIKPNYEHLRAFGCECFPLIPAKYRHKLEPTTVSCVFIGYSDMYKGYKCLNPQNNQIIMSRHVTFNETSFPFSLTSKTTNSMQPVNMPPGLLAPYPTYTTHQQTLNHPIQGTGIQNHGENSAQYSPQQVFPQTVAPTSISETVVQHGSIHPMVTRIRTGSLKPRNRLNLLHMESELDTMQDPTSYSEASKHVNWRNAMASEFYALQQQGTWSLVPRPPNSSVLGCKWTYKTKTHADGSIAKYKARLVAHGNHQEFGLDYTETFSPVAKLPTIRILLAIALKNNWKVQQLDVANAFLHGNLDEIVYMKQPHGFEDNTNPDYVCRLHKAIYGLKQAPRQWYNVFTSTLVDMGFTHSSADPSLLIFRKQDTQIYMLLYVDDVLLTGNNTSIMDQILLKLNTKFAMKHLGEAHMFLRITIDRFDNKFFLSQEAYARSILKSAKLTNCNNISNPTCTKVPLDPPTDALLSDVNTNRKITGSLQYLTLTRPDIAYSVNQLSQYMHHPDTQHIYLLKRLLRYIQGTSNYGIPILKSDLHLTSFSDADWAGDPISRKSTSGYCSFIGRSLILWTVKKQHTVARSSTESEYRALAALAADVIWLRRLLSDFGVSQTLPTDIYCDNTSAIALANNPVFHARTKHIEIDHRFLRDHIRSKTIRLLPISTIDQTADIFTKALTTPRFHQLRAKLTVTPRPISLRGDIRGNETHSNMKQNRPVADYVPH